MSEVITLNISDDFVQKLNSADNKIKELVTTSKNARESIIQHFKDMGNLGVDEFIRKINLAQEALRGLSGGQIRMPSLGAFGQDASLAADKANELIATLLKISTINLERISKNKELQEMHSILNARRKEAVEYKKQQNEIKALDNEAKQRKRDLVQQDKDNANQARITSEQRKTATEREVQSLKHEQSQLKLNEATFKMYTQAMMMSEVTLNSRNKKIERLKTVLQEMQREEHKYGSEIEMTKKKIQALERENEKYQQSLRRVKKSKKNLMDVAGQLQRRLALVFSVSQIMGYFGKLVAVRKEMELQQKSLQVLLQNKDEADKLWNQVLNLAVKSPFRVKELVTYTKQLAAYRIESEKLFDTTKRLSDVAAGLGVDMNRLILAYGQIRAAGFLRGTELRQLTEAGLPMLDELAKYFTELEGRAIRTGDVFEMISKRMVSFKDVEIVFQRMTNEGGVFFNMQEEQAKTLAGQISNLYDSIDLMLNAIGSFYDKDLKSGIQHVRDFVANWRDVAEALKFILTMSEPFLIFWGLSKIAMSSFGQGLLAVVTSSKAGAKALSRFDAYLRLIMGSSKAATAAASGLKMILGGIATLGIGAALSLAVSALIKFHLEVTRASREAKELKRNLDNIIYEDTSNLEKQVDGFKDLTTRLNEANAGSKERRDIITDLNSRYGEYLEFVVNETTSIKDLSDAYDSVVRKMKEKASLSTLEKGLQAISDSYGKSLEDATNSFYDMLSGASIKKEGDKWGLSSITPTKKEIDDIFNLVQTRIREADKESIDSLQEQQQLIQDVIKGYYGEGFFLSRDYAKSIELIDIMVDKKTKEEELQKRLNNEYKQTLQSREANLAFEKLENEYRQKQRDIKGTAGLSDFDVKQQLENAAKQFELDKIELKFRFGEISQREMIDAKNKVWKWASETVLDVNNKIVKELSPIYSDEQLSQILISQEEFGSGMSAIIKNTVEGWELANSIIAEQISLASAENAIDEKVLNNAKIQADLYEKRAEYLGIELDLVKKIDKASVESINSKLPDEYRISLEDSYKSVMTLQEEANKKRQDAIALQETLIQQEKRGVSVNSETLKQAASDVENFTKKWKLLGGLDKEKKPKKESLVDEQIKVIDDMNKKYKELNKTLSKTESLQGAFDSFKDAFSSAYKRNDVKDMTAQEFASKVLNFPNEDDIVQWLDNLINMAKDVDDKIKIELAKGDYVYDMKVRAKIEDDKMIVDQIEEMLSGHEMFIELEKMNIPPDLAKKLFNIDSIPLPNIKNMLISKKDLFDGNEMEEKYKEFLERVDELESEAQVNRLKRFAKFLTDTSDEIARIQSQGALDISYAKGLFTQGKIDANDYAQIIKHVVSEVNADISKINLEKFKESPEYIAAMGNMAAYSVRELDLLSNKIQDIINKNSGSMSVDEIKAYNDALNKIAEQKKKLSSPFGSTWITELREINELEGKINEEKARQVELQQRLVLQQQTLVMLQEQLAELQGKPQTVGVQGQIQGVMQQINEVQNGIANTNGEINTTTGNISNMGNKLSAITKGMGGAMGMIDMIVKGISQSIEATIQLFNDFKEMMDSFGHDTDSGGWEDATLAMETLGNVNQKVTQSWEDFKSGNFAGAVANSIGAVTSLITGLNKIHDAKYERQIQREIEYIESLQHAYEKLGKAIDDAYSIEKLETGGRQAQKNLENQIASYEKMIQAEEDKKDTDDERIKEWKLTIEELKEDVIELNKDLVSTATDGILDSVLSASQAFTDAWLDAFNKTGDGLIGLENNFKSTMLDMVKQQAAMLISQSYVEKWKKQLEQYINPDDLELSTDEASKWVDAVSSSLPQLNQALQNYFLAMQQAGVDLSGGQSEELTGLQRGIQGITEETAQVIEAYLNSIRFFVSESNTSLSMIAQSLSNNDVENPMVSQLKIIAAQTSAINTLLQSLTKGGHSMGGVGLKVFIS